MDKTSPYVKCPEYESEHFRLRLVSTDDAEDLFLCYSDTEAQKIFNSDNCNTDFKFATLEHMRAYIDGWIDAYKNGYFVRFSIITKADNKAVGTVEIFGGDYGVLRIDILTAYENENCLDELLKIADSFFHDFECENIITKAIPEAVCRRNALVQNEYAPTAIGDGMKREHYFFKAASDSLSHLR